MHVITRGKPVFHESILNLLCDAGAHLDFNNAFGQTPLDLATMAEAKQLLKIRMKFSLKCLCAQLIQKKNIAFRGNLAISLVNFVEKH